MFPDPIETIDTIDNMTQNEAWETYVGSQSPQEFVDFAGNVMDYVTSSPMCAGLSAADRDQVAELLARHIEANA